MKGDVVPDGHHITRLCGGSHIREIGTIAVTAFKQRPGEAYLSVNWLESPGLRRIHLVPVFPDAAGVPEAHLRRVGGDPGSRGQWQGRSAELLDPGSTVGRPGKRVLFDCARTDCMSFLE